MAMHRVHGCQPGATKDHFAVVASGCDVEAGGPVTAFLEHALEVGAAALSQRDLGGCLACIRASGHQLVVVGWGMSVSSFHHATLLQFRVFIMSSRKQGSPLLLSGGFAPFTLP